MPPFHRRAGARPTAFAVAASSSSGAPNHPAAFSGQQLLPALTSVRFLFALGVVLFHLELIWSWQTRQYTDFIERARLGVDLFFVLSGFVLSLVYRRQIEERRYNHGRFLIARLARIYPAHALILAAMGVVAIVATAMGQGFDATNYSLAGFVKTALLVQSWAPSAHPVEWNGPSWSLSAEWAAYLAFPFLAVLGTKGRPIALLVLTVAVFVTLDQLFLRLAGRSVLHVEENLGVLRIIPSFLAGVGLYGLSLRISLSPRAAVTGAIDAGAALILLMHFGAPEPIIVGCGAALIFFLALVSKAGADGPLGWPAFIFLGEASYAIYLVHQPMITVWRNLHALLAGGDSRYRLAGWEVASLIVLAIVAGCLIHAAFERPAREWIRRRLLKDPI